MESFKFTLSLLISIFAIVGGIILFLQNPLLEYKGLILLATILVVVFAVKFIVGTIEPSKSPILIRTNFSSFLPKINLKDKPEFEKLCDLTKCAFTLLLLEQTESGTWSNSYLYRRIISNEGIPLSKGSLTGTPLALFSILSLIDKDDHDFIEYLTGNLTETLNKVIQPDGQYLRRYTIGQVGRVPEMEPPRHTAGGLLCAIIIGDITELDKVCLKFLLDVKALPDAWDKGIVIRTLTSVIYDNHFSSIDRLKSYRRRNRLINLLIEEAKFAKHQSLIWSHPYEYGKDINNQWATIWALYPLISDKLLSSQKRRALQKILKNLIKSHIAASLDKSSLLPAEIVIENFQGKGEYVFSTALTPTILHAFENYSVSEHEQTSLNALNRILSNAKKIIKNPTQSPNQDIKSLEGYFAWAGMCLTSASFGIAIDKTSTKLIVKLVKELRSIKVDSSLDENMNIQIEKYLQKYNIFSDEFIDPLKISIGNLLQYRDAVQAEEYKLS